MSTSDPCELGATEMARAVRAGRTSAGELVEACLVRIAAGARLNAYLAVLDRHAREAAARIDARCARGEAPGPLAGVPVAVKDNICVTGAPTTCGSRHLADHRPVYDATAVARLRAAGAVVMGKTNLDEFGMGSSGEYSAFGPTLNPWHPERVPGGSSSGSAAAVAARTVPVALGSDTGGSVRQPAAHCGVIGMKPTYGRVSRHGLVAFASSLDQIGVFARSIDDARLLLRVMAGEDVRDATVSTRADAWPASGAGERPRLAVPGNLVAAGLAPEVAACLDATRSCFEDLGARCIAVDWPALDRALAAYTVLAAAEAASNLARYDGVRFGARAAEATDPAALIARSRARGLGPEVQRRILIGTFVLRDGYYDAYYRRAQAARAEIRQWFDRVLAGVDAILLPTAPGTAFPFGEKAADPLAMYLADVCTVAVNLAGAPAISVPAGWSATGLPIGMQLVGGAWQEETLLDLAERLTAARPELHTRRPPAEGGA